MLKQRFLVQFGSNAILHLVATLGGIVVARLAGPTVMGTISYATAYTGVFGFINGIFGSPHIKLASEGRNHDECLGVYARLTAVTGIIYFLAVIGWFLTQKYLLHYQFESLEVQIVIILALLFNVLHKYEGYSQTVYTAKMQQAKANLPGFIRGMLYHVGRVVIVLLGGAAVAMSAWNLLLSIIVIPLIYRFMKEYPIGRYNPVLAKEYFRLALPILIIVVVTSITTFADKLLLAHYTSTTQLGYFSAANSIGGMFMLIAGPVGMIFFPLFSSMIAKGDWAGVNNNVRKYQEIIVLFVLPLVCAVGLVGGEFLILVLGSKYQPSIRPFVVLLFSTYFLLWGMPYGNILSGMGKFNLSALINVIKLAVFFLSVTILVSPKFLNLGATGVALNILVLNVLVNMLCIFFAKKLGDIKLDKKNYLRHLAVLAMVGLGYFGAPYAKTIMPYWWLVYAPLFLVLTYALLVLTGLLKKEHWLAMLDIFKYKKTLNYINGEIRGGQ